MRRGLSFCLMLVMILTMAWVPVSAEEQPAKIEIRTPEVLPKAGEEFEVVAYISNNPGIKGISMDLFAENNEFECKSIKLGDLTHYLLFQLIGSTRLLQVSKINLI